MQTYRPHPEFSPRPSSLALAISLVLGLGLTGCSSVATKSTESTTKGTQQADAGKVVPPYKGGGYYKDDGPGANPPSNLDAIPDAVPKEEPTHRYANNAYKVLGKRYVPLADNTDYKARGLASWYGRKFHGNSTSIGEPYDMYAMSAAHPTLPLPSYAKVTNLENGKSVVVRVNDRGPFHPGRIIDLSYTAAYKLDILKGVTRVEVEAVQAGAAPTSFTAMAEENLTPDLPPPVAKVEPAPLAPGKAVYLQLGAFANPATAEAVMERVTAKLSSTFPGVMRLEMNGLYKIQAGPFANTEAADQAAALVQRDMGIKAFKVLAEAPPVSQSTSQPAAPLAIVASNSPAIPPAANQPTAAPTEVVTNTTTAAATTAPPPSTPAPGLYLQLAALSSPAAADALASRIKNRFGDELPGLNQINNGNLFKLQAGPFNSPAAADQVALAYQQDFGVKPYRINR